MQLNLAEGVFAGVPFPLIIKFAEEVRNKDLSFLMPEFKKLYLENIDLKEKVRLLELKVDALVELRSKLEQNG